MQAAMHYCVLRANAKVMPNQPIGQPDSPKLRFGCRLPQMLDITWMKLRLRTSL